MVGVLASRTRKVQSFMFISYDIYVKLAFHETSVNHRCFAGGSCRRTCSRGKSRWRGIRLAAAVVFHLPLETPYHYLVPEALRPLIQPGQRVQAPFGAGNKPTIGYCVEVTSQPPSGQTVEDNLGDPGIGTARSARYCSTVAMDRGVVSVRAGRRCCTRSFRRA